MRRTVPAILVLLSLFVGCKAKELADKAAISRDLDKRGTTDLLKEVADDKYRGLREPRDILPKPCRRRGLPALSPGA